MNEKNILLEKIKTKKAKIAVIGLGYVGLPLLLRFFEEDFHVKGFDIDRKKITKLREGNSYIKHIPEDLIKATKNSDKVSFHSDPTSLRDMDVFILCVPTPLTRHKEPDLKPILSAMETIDLHTRSLIILESTTYPGTTDEILKSNIEFRGFVVGKHIFLAFSPEREDPGNPVFHTKNTPKVVGGCTPDCLELATAIYEQIVDTVVPVSSSKIAEMAKILENTYRLVNISFINEMKMVCEKMGMDIFEVIEAAKTKPFGYTPYYPCGGVGGHCLPLDPFYLRFKAREFNIPTKFIELAGEINDLMPQYVVDVVTKALNQKNKSVKNSWILLLGIAYKKNIDDVRESAALEIRDLLETLGANVRYSDPYIPILDEKRHSYQPEAASIPDFDCVVLLTDHDSFDYDLIYKNSRIIVDTRGRYKPDGKRIFRA